MIKSLNEGFEYSYLSINKRLGCVKGPSIHFGPKSQYFGILDEITRLLKSNR